MDQISVRFSNHILAWSSTKEGQKSGGEIIAVLGIDNCPG